jgi:hypothetical protein
VYKLFVIIPFARNTLISIKVDTWLQ